MKGLVETKSIDSQEDYREKLAEVGIVIQGHIAYEVDIKFPIVTLTLPFENEPLIIEVDLIKLTQSIL